MHPRPAILTAVLIAAILAAGCTFAPPQPSPAEPTPGEGGALPTATTAEPALSTPATPTPSPATTATPKVSPTAVATSPSPAATPTAAWTDTGDAPTPEPTTILPTQPPSPAATPIPTATPTACATATATAAPTSTATAGATYTAPQLKYLLLDHYGEDRFFFCDPDEYPVPVGDELGKALEAFPAIENETAEYAAITERTGLRPPHADEAKLTIYREHKKLRAIPLGPGPAGSSTYSLALGTEGEGRRVSGVVRTDGTILEERSEAAVLTCPICLAAGTRIATPAGPVAVEDVREGTIVWTVDAKGERIAAPVLLTARTRAPSGHEVVRVRLSDGREVTASPGHPMADGSPLGRLRPGDMLDGATVSGIETVPYGGEYTYDLLPAGQSGRYWADGLLLGSTLG